MTTLLEAKPTPGGVAPAGGGDIIRLTGVLGPVILCSLLAEPDAEPSTGSGITCCCGVVGLAAVDSEAPGDGIVDTTSVADCGEAMEPSGDPDTHGGGGSFAGGGRNAFFSIDGGGNKGAWSKMIFSVGRMFSFGLT